jgi:hypothetical protein
LLLSIGMYGCESSTDVADVPRMVSGVPDPCALLPQDVLEEIVEASVTESKLGDTEVGVVRASCFYRYEDAGFGLLTVEDAAAWERRYAAERSSYETRGFRLPDDRPVSGLGDHAVLDVRHNELNVRSGDFVLRADHGRRLGSGSGALTPAEKAASRDLQKDMLREALSRLPAADG